MSLARETARNALLMVAARTSSLVISVGSILFNTRWLSTDELALLTVLNVLAQTCIILSDFGLGLAVDRRLPGLLASDPAAGRDLARTYLWVSSLVAAGLCAVLILLADPISRIFLDGAIPPALISWGIPYVMAIVGHQLLTILLRGSRNYGALSKCIPINQIAWSVLSIGTFILIARGSLPSVERAIGPNAALKSFILLQGVAQFPALIVFSRPIWRLLAGVPSPATAMLHLRLALPYHAERYVNFIATYGDQWVVAAFMTNELKAIYYVPRNFFDRIMTTLDGVTSVPLTALSTAAARGTESLRRGILVMRRALLYIFGISGASLLVGSHLLVDLLAGSKYHAGGVTPFRILAIHFVIIGMFMIHQQAVNAAGRPGDRLRVVIVQNLASLLSLAILGWFFSLNGVVLARVVAALAGGWASWHYLRKIIPLSPDWRAMGVIAVPCVSVTTLILVCEPYHYVGTRDLSSLLWGLTHWGLGVLVMILVLLRLMPDDDIHRIEEVMPARLNWVLRLGRWLRRDGRSNVPPAGATPAPIGMADPPA